LFRPGPEASVGHPSGVKIRRFKYASSGCPDQILDEPPSTVLDSLYCMRVPGSSQSGTRVML
jgi:hypothetical protein